MKKIVAAFDGLKFSESTLAYAVAIARDHNAHLVGVFLNDMTYFSRSPYRVMADAENSYRNLETLEEEDAGTRRQAVDKFSAACSAAALNFSVHKDKYIALQELLHESVYADLVVIDAAETLNRYADAPPAHFMRDFLADAHCPVLVVPRTYVPVRSSVLLYDGEPSSVYAVKMFSYLLPVQSALPAEVITIRESDENLHLPDNALMKEFMKRHHNKAVYTVARGDADEEIPARLRMNDASTLVVLGAYRRSAVSRFFRESMADRLIRELKWPLFIAHQ
ncbi:universal stress protein [Chitinophaga agri]|uniref:Universal stress protein n=1 Tax=Chitinophaga agri TaxID=2703787 RepID=A0A6B9Z832_9BACT|nr:universal stress protein [Chitinophaga agri]QHS58157.1 universal stress protein [Chitinophaga agri]